MPLSSSNAPIPFKGWSDLLDSNLSHLNPIALDFIKSKLLKGGSYTIHYTQQLYNFLPTNHGTCKAPSQHIAQLKAEYACVRACMHVRICIVTVPLMDFLCDLFNFLFGSANSLKMILSRASFDDDVPVAAAAAAIWELSAVASASCGTCCAPLPPPPPAVPAVPAVPAASGRPFVWTSISPTSSTNSANDTVWSLYLHGCAPLGGEQEAKVWEQNGMKRAEGRGGGREGEEGGLEVHLQPFNLFIHSALRLYQQRRGANACEIAQERGRRRTNAHREGGCRLNAMRHGLHHNIKSTSGCKPTYLSMRVSYIVESPIQS